MHQSSSPNTICWIGYFYPIVYSCTLCQILIDHRDLGLYLSSLFCSIDLCIFSYASTRLFWLQWPCIIVDVRYCDSSHFVLLSQNCHGYLGSFMIPYKFLKYLLSVKYFIGILIRIALDLQIALGNMDILVILILPIHEHSICFHLFVSSLTYFFSVL